ncbi:CoA-acylating methylmalonate-semialdehyde dehydrogenase [Vibrio sp.]|uniref:CoA-acylating methylmalonate-semialdehyde dehydrogenase n=1 Tax=Vibrio viridaestus TaxID=2487322 RepID=A0A3N9THU7_9VIBR|nr:CoA-acylating methylmalonate-semialdehyde dehydrogenase [Vibrio viridaestus]MDC0610745.1 CoA-acylating methylmalonate-semialdehyde dehydrogenase [Vibrio sp.]RQW63630.1 CoA-acylating methylmalonate-semialdehyde dehydrogenase [Vibrio viridaestus]
MSDNTPKKLKYYAAGWKESKTSEYMDCHNPSNGEVIALAPKCTIEEVEEAISTAKTAFESWKETPPNKRVQVLFKMKTLLDEHLDELTALVALENGKCWNEAKGDVLKVTEVVEFACGIPHLMKGTSLMNVSRGYDTVQFKEPMGVFAGIAPWNFPAMIPMGWMAPMAIATGNTLVIKAASFVPQTSMRILELWEEAGLPAGVLNLVTCSRHESELLLRHPDIKGVSFVGSTGVGLHIYSTAAANGKRVQALTEAKNHALVLKDAHLPRTVAGIMNSSFGCAGERCMALPVIVAEEEIADDLVELLVSKMKELKVGPATSKDSQLGPVINAGHKEFVTNWIEKGISEGAKLVVDGRQVTVEGYENGFYVGPTLFDHVTPEMEIGQKEVFGPVLCIKRVKSFEEGIAQMNANEFANGSVIYTQSGYYARQFAKQTDGGMVGVNVGIPVPVGIFGFTGHKHSFFGDLHAMGEDGVRFFTELKTVTTTWFDEEEGKKHTTNTWDGTI